MGIKTASFLAALVSVSLGAAPFAQEALSPDAAYEARKAQMRSFGGTMRNLRSLEGDAMVDAANMYVEGFDAIQDLFPEGSIVDESRALPAIWEDWNGFLAMIEKANEAAIGLRIAVETGDQAAFLVAAEALGPTCQECHDNYRAPE